MTDLLRQTDDASVRLPPPLLDLAEDALFLDLDGTLVEIEQEPDLVSSDPALRVLLRDLAMRMNGALAIVSGRRVADVDRILHDVAVCVSGLHGSERRIGEAFYTAPASKTVRQAADALRARIAGVDKVFVEDKGAAVALHYRRAPEQAAFAQEIGAEIAEQLNLRMLRGKMVVELLPHEASKAQAISQLMREPAFAGRKPVAVGDDVTDEDAFSAAQRLGGYGLLVGPPRETQARHRVPGVMGVRSWLLASLGRVGA